MPQTLSAISGCQVNFINLRKLAEQTLPFATPKPLWQGCVAGQHVFAESRLPGISLDKLMPDKVFLSYREKGAKLLFQNGMTLGEQCLSEVIRNTLLTDSEQLKGYMTQPQSRIFQATLDTFGDCQ